MTIEQYNKKANEYNTKLRSLRSAVSSCDCRLIDTDEDGNHDLSEWGSDTMYRAELMLTGLGSELKYLSQKMTELNAAYFELLINNK